MPTRRTIGAQDNSAPEARADVVVFTTEPLTAAVEIHGVPVIELHIAPDNANGDLFLRVCDVDGGGGRSVNVTDQTLRHTDRDTEPDRVRTVRRGLDPTALRFQPGHRIRLQGSGGGRSRFARNLGTGEDPAISTATRPVTHTIHHDATRASVLGLPTVAST